MRLPSRARYGLWMMLEVARCGPSGTISLGDIALRTRTSRRYLDNIAASLRDARLLQGQSGRGGGYQLARTPETVRISEIIEAVLGPLSIVECVRSPEACLQSELCPCRWVYSTINERIVKVLDQLTLADLQLETVQPRRPSTLGEAVAGCPSRVPGDAAATDRSFEHEP